jgi:hypothetical protein
MLGFVQRIVHGIRMNPELTDDVCDLASSEQHTVIPNIQIMSGS